MQNFVYCAPTEIVFGRGGEDRVSEFVRKYGGTRVLVIYGGSSAEKSGLLDRVIKNLRDSGIEARSSGGVVPNPLLSTARRKVREAVDFRADFVLAVGGGSVIDTAKAVAHGAAEPERDLWDYWTGTRVEKSLPFGCILTISAAGSETSDSCVLTNDETEPHTKRGMSCERNRCRFAILDPALTMTLPKRQIGAGVADIFMHTSERYFAPVLGNHLTDEIAEGLFRDITLYGPKGYRNPQDYEAMSEIMWCGSISHMGLTGLGSRGDTPRDGDWACHQMGMALSALRNCTHGASLTAVWGSWASYVCHENMARFAQFARRVWSVPDQNDAAAAEKGIERTEEFFRSVGMPLTLTELLGKEPTEREIREFTDECTFQRTRTIGGFKVLSCSDILRIYDMAR